MKEKREVRDMFLIVESERLCPNPFDTFDGVGSARYVFFGDRMIDKLKQIRSSLIHKPRGFDYNSVRVAGGYTDNVADAGGAFLWGISQSVFLESLLYRKFSGV